MIQKDPRKEDKEKRERDMAFRSEGLHPAVDGGRVHKKDIYAKASQVYGYNSYYSFVVATS